MKFGTRSGRSVIEEKVTLVRSSPISLVKPFGSMRTLNSTVTWLHAGVDSMPWHHLEDMRMACGSFLTWDMLYLPTLVISFSFEVLGLCMMQRHGKGKGEWSLLCFLIGAYSPVNAS